MGLTKLRKKLQNDLKLFKLYQCINIYIYKQSSSLERA